MTKYKVLWFDDEYDQLELIAEQALDHDIQLKGVSNAKKGLERLQSDQKEYDAVLLDGKFFLDDTKHGDDVNDQAFGQVAKYLNDLKNQGIYIPWFIYSGQTSFVKDKHMLVELFGSQAEENGRVFDKNRDEDAIQLFTKMVTAIEGSSLYKIKLRYKEVFDACAENILGQSEETRLLAIISSLESEENNQNTSPLFTPLRMVIEKMMDKLRALSIIPKEIIQLNTSSLFLSGKHHEYNLNEEIVPPVIAHLLYQVLQVVQDASHNKEGLRLKVDEYLQNTNSRFLYRATAFQVLELVVWFKSFVESNPQAENWINVNNPDSGENVEAELIAGTVINLNPDKGFAFFKPDAIGDNIYIPVHLVASHALHNEMPIEVQIEDYNDKSTGEKKSRVKKIVEIR